VRWCDRSADRGDFCCAHPLQCLWIHLAQVVFKFVALLAHSRTGARSFLELSRLRGARPTATTPWGTTTSTWLLPPPTAFRWETPRVCIPAPWSGGFLPFLAKRLQTLPWICCPVVGSPRRSPRTTEMRILLMAANQGPNALFCMPNRTKCILLISVVMAGSSDAVLHKVCVTACQLTYCQLRHPGTACRTTLCHPWESGHFSLLADTTSPRRFPGAGVLTETTAELALALTFSAARRVVEGDKFMRAGLYKGWLPSLFVGTCPVVRCAGRSRAGHVAKGRRLSRHCGGSLGPWGCVGAGPSILSCVPKMDHQV
jgi:hypothetical protein